MIKATAVATAAVAAILSSIAENRRQSLRNKMRAAPGFAAPGQYLTTWWYGIPIPYLVLVLLK